jgi:chromosome segregation ATPase
MDLVVQERKISRADAQLMGLKAHYAALQREKTEAEMALEEAEAFRASLSDQLMHLLQHAEGEVKRRMREVVRSQPRHPHAAAPLALLPNRKVLETARKATLEAQVRRRGSSLEREKEEGGRGGEGVALV